MMPMNSLLACGPAVTSRAALLGTVVATAATLAACATYDVGAAEPIPIGDGIYTIAADSGAGLHSATYQRAIRFCFEQGKQLLRLDTQAGTAQQAGTSMQFRCVGPGEPGWKQPAG
jgi:hypothetical protein